MERVTGIGQVAYVAPLSFATGYMDYVPQIILATDGNIYRTATTGVSYCGLPSGNGCGAIFRLSEDNVYSLVHTFAARDGATPTGIV